MRLQIKNTWSNHTGLAAMNLGLANQLSVRKHDKREYGEWPRKEYKHLGYFGFRPKRLIRHLFIGWFGRKDIWKCRLRIVRDHG